MFACEKLTLKEAVGDIFLFSFPHSRFGFSQWTASQARTMVAGPGAQLPHRPGPEEAGGWVLGEPLSRLKYGGAR